ETHVIRLFAKDTNDERIYKLQTYKEGEIRSAMNQGKMPKPLSQEERYWLLTNRHAPDLSLGEYDDDDDEDDTLTNNDPDSDDGWQTD
ncbi:hypothetical protein GGR55DRAFT_620261, partial [Xylaria sp. FL0064]